MINMKLLDFWGSFQTNEKRMIKILLFLLPLIVVFIYLADISNKISAKKLNLEVAKANFDYVYDKALNFQKYSLAQKAVFDYPEKKDFIFSESKRYPLIDFQFPIQSSSKLKPFFNRHLSAYEIFILFEYIS